MQALLRFCVAGLGPAVAGTGRGGSGVAGPVADQDLTAGASHQGMRCAGKGTAYNADRWREKRNPSAAAAAHRGACTRLCR